VQSVQWLPTAAAGLLLKIEPNTVHKVGSGLRRFYQDCANQVKGPKSGKEALGKSHFA
jgi:hypothetical protein